MVRRYRICKICVRKLEMPLFKLKTNYSQFQMLHSKYRMKHSKYQMLYPADLRSIRNIKCSIRRIYGAFEASNKVFQVSNGAYQAYIEALVRSARHCKLTSLPGRLPRSLDAFPKAPTRSPKLRRVPRSSDAVPKARTHSLKLGRRPQSDVNSHYTN